MKRKESLKITQVVDFNSFPRLHNGARGGTRTRTVLLPSGPKPGASTNFATRAIFRSLQTSQAKMFFRLHEIGQL